MREREGVRLSTIKTRRTISTEFLNMLLPNNISNFFKPGRHVIRRTSGNVNYLACLEDTQRSGLSTFQTVKILRGEGEEIKHSV